MSWVTTWILCTALSFCNEEVGVPPLDEKLGWRYRGSKRRAAMIVSVRSSRPLRQGLEGRKGFKPSYPSNPSVTQHVNFKMMPVCAYLPSGLFTRGTLVPSTHAALQGFLWHAWAGIFNATRSQLSGPEPLLSRSYMVLIVNQILL